MTTAPERGARCIGPATRSGRRTSRCTCRRASLPAVARSAAGERRRYGRLGQRDRAMISIIPIPHKPAVQTDGASRGR